MLVFVLTCPMFGPASGQRRVAEGRKSILAGASANRSEVGRVYKTSADKSANKAGLWLKETTYFGANDRVDGLQVLLQDLFLWQAAS